MQCAPGLSVASLGTMDATILVSGCGLGQTTRKRTLKRISATEFGKNAAHLTKKEDDYLCYILYFAPHKTGEHKRFARWQWYQENVQ